MAGSQAAIAVLHALGWTDASIGRAVGRNSSLIHQIATGKKPGANLSESLGALSQSGLPGPKNARLLPDVRLPEAPRRTRQSGQPARVREGRQEREARGPSAPLGGKGGKGGGARQEREHLRSAGGARELPNGQRYISGSSKASARFAAGVASDLSDSARVKIAYKDADGKWHAPGQKGGMTPELVRGFLQGRTWREALAAIAEYFYGGGAAEPTGEAEFYVTA